jgi:2,3-bisphosphoglycerate-dependent phosphoglycerate mutase
MGIGFRVGSIVDEIGTPDFLHAFFSTISYHLEPKGWGTRFPELMTGIYQGKLDSRHARKVLADLATIRRELSAYSPDKVVWDIENKSASPPWGNDISSDITSLANYFVTSGGQDLFDVLIECLEALEQEGGELVVE